jgi:two-component system NtrC family response regulator
LIVEDELGIQRQLKWLFAEQYSVVEAGDRRSAITAVRRFQPTIVMLDLGLPPSPDTTSEGMNTLQEILQLAPRTKVIVLTGNSTKDAAVNAIGLGAYDFYQKPVDPDIIRLVVDRAIRLADLEAEHHQLVQIKRKTPLEGVITSSHEMLAACRVVEKVAPTNVTALILGESGTGKELLARAIHSLSGRSSGNFVAINCAAIPDTLLESELFGYERGAFTGAVKKTLGRIEYAEKGTLFLDEVGDISPALQAKLLRFLQERVIERLGGRESVAVDVRVVCATNRDVHALMATNEFREDLYYRVSEVTIDVPPLRERSGDALLLARVFLREFSEENHRPALGLSEDAMSAIESYKWPGNVRELENRVRRAVILCDTNVVTARDLSLSVESEIIPLNLRSVRDQAEKSTVLRALLYSDGNLSRASDLLGITRPTLYSLLDKHMLNARKSLQIDD